MTLDFSVTECSDPDLIAQNRSKVREEKLFVVFDKRVGVCDKSRRTSNRKEGRSFMTNIHVVGMLNKRHAREF